MTKRRKRRQFQKKSAQLSQSQLDIIIPVYGRPDLLAKCLKGLEVNTLAIDYNLIIVDDKSPNLAELEPIYNSLNLLRSSSVIVATPPTNGLDGLARLIKHEQNKGFPATCNDGAAQGNSPAILFLNSDVVLQPGAIQAMLDTLWNDDLPPSRIAPEQGPVGVVGPMLLFPEDSTDHIRPAGKVQHAGLDFNLSGQSIHVNIGWSRDNPKVTMQRGVQAVTGACLMTRRETWNAAAKTYQAVGDPSGGGFNLVYGRGTYEDLEYCFVARSNNYRVVYEPEAMGYHMVGGSSNVVGENFDLQRNASIFRARCGHLMLWAEWMWY